MIAKSKVGRSFGGTIRYLFEGHIGEQSDKRAELLDYNFIRPEKEAMIKDFDRHRWLNPDLGSAVGHLITAYHVDDTAKVNNTIIIAHAKRIMIEGGIDPDNTQWAVILHQDRDHVHAHTVYNRVDLDGRTIKDNFLGVKVTKAADRIAREYGLTIAAEKKKDLKLTHQDRLPGHDRVRYEIYKALTKELASATSIDKLKKALQDGYGIETKVQKNGEGMSFRSGTYAFKASEIDRRYSGKKIHAQIEHNGLSRQRRTEKAAQVRNSYGVLQAHQRSRRRTSSKFKAKAIEKRDKRNSKFLEFMETISRFQKMSSPELQALFNQVGKGERQLTDMENRALGKLVKASPEIRLEYQKYKDGKAESREKEITERLNRFYYGVGASGAKHEYRGINALAVVGGIKKKGQMGFVAEYLARDFSDPESAATRFEERLNQEYSKAAQVTVGAPYQFVRDWSREKKHLEPTNRKILDDSDQWQKRNNGPLSQDQQEVMAILKAESEYYEGTRPMKHSRGQKQ